MTIQAINTTAGTLTYAALGISIGANATVTISNNILLNFSIDPNICSDLRLGNLLLSDTVTSYTGDIAIKFLSNIIQTVEFYNDASGNTIPISYVGQGSTTSNQAGLLIQSATTTNAPTYVTAKTNPLSSDTSGNLRISLKDSPVNTNKFLVTTDPITFASAQPVTQSGTWTVQPGNTANTTPWLVTDSSDGPVTPGAVAAKSNLIGGQFNTTLPTLTNTQQSAIQLDSSGRILVSGISPDTAPATINVTARDIASTTTVVANGQNFITGAATANSTASFAFASECAVVIQVTGAWTGTLQIEISLDGGTTWSPTSVNQDGTDYTLNAFTGNFTGRANVSAYTNLRLRAITAWTGTATVKVIESINPATVYIANAVRLTDQGGNAGDISPNNDLQVVDTIDTAGQYRAQSVTTSAAEALGAGTILANRKMLSITPTNGTVYWGFSNAVTTANGTPIFKNQNAVFSIGSNIHIFVIAASTVDCRMAEGS